MNDTPENEMKLKDFTDQAEESVEPETPNPIQSCPEGYDVVKDGLSKIKSWRVNMQMELIRLGSEPNTKEDKVTVLNHLLAIGNELFRSVDLIHDLEHSLAFVVRQIGGIIANNENLLQFFDTKSKQTTETLSRLTTLGLEKGGSVWEAMKEQLEGKGVKVLIPSTEAPDLRALEEKWQHELSSTSEQLNTEIGAITKDLNEQMHAVIGEQISQLNTEIGAITKDLNAQMHAMINEQISQSMTKVKGDTETLISEHLKAFQVPPEKIAPIVERLMQPALEKMAQGKTPEAPAPEPPKPQELVQPKTPLDMLTATFHQQQAEAAEKKKETIPQPTMTIPDFSQQKSAPEPAKPDPAPAEEVGELDI